MPRLTKQSVYAIANRLACRGVDVDCHSENGKYIVTNKDQSISYSPYLSLKELEIFLTGFEKGYAATFTAIREYTNKLKDVNDATELGQTTRKDI